MKSDITMRVSRSSETSPYRLIGGVILGMVSLAVGFADLITMSTTFVLNLAKRARKQDTPTTYDDILRTHMMAEKRVKRNFQTAILLSEVGKYQAALRQLDQVVHGEGLSQAGKILVRSVRACCFIHLQEYQRAYNNIL